MISQEKYKTLRARIATIERESDKLRDEFKIMGIEDNGAMVIFQNYRRGADMLRSKLGAVQVDDTDRACDRMFGKE